MGLGVIALAALPSCEKVRAKSDTSAAVTVGVTKVVRKSLQRKSPFPQNSFPFRKSTFMRRNRALSKSCTVDYGSRVQAGQLMAVLEIPELEAQLQEDQAAIKNSTDEVSRAEHQLKRYQAQYKVCTSNIPA